MKMFKRIISLCVLFVGFQLITEQVIAQCAMCSLNAENSTQNGNTQGKGLNNGILFLLGMPFLIGAGAGILWYTKFRNKEEKSTFL